MISTICVPGATCAPVALLLEQPQSDAVLVLQIQTLQAANKELEKRNLALETFIRNFSQFHEAMRQYALHQGVTIPERIAFYEWLADEGPAKFNTKFPTNDEFMKNFKKLTLR